MDLSEAIYRCQICGDIINTRWGIRKDSPPVGTNYICIDCLYRTEDPENFKELCELEKIIYGQSESDIIT